MKTSSKERTLQWICNQSKKGNISFSHKLQRPINQWNSKMKSLLIHSLLVGFPVNPIYVVDQEGIIYTLDGSQRTSTCIAYVNNEFALSKDTPNITITSNENGESITKEYEIAGKKFKKLDEEVQSTLLACSLEFCTLSDYTDDATRQITLFQLGFSEAAAKQIASIAGAVFAASELGEQASEKVSTVNNPRGFTCQDEARAFLALNVLLGNPDFILALSSAWSYMKYSCQFNLNKSMELGGEQLPEPFSAPCSVLVDALWNRVAEPLRGILDDMAQEVKRGTRTLDIPD